MMESPILWPTEDEAGMEDEGEEERDEAIKRLVFETPIKPEIHGRAAASKKQPVVVYLRVRPKSQREVMSMDASCLHLIGRRELQAVAPATSQTFKNRAGGRCPGETSQQFSFTHVFDEGASQRDVFEEALVPTLRDFFGGQNCLVFTYGVTNSGKTYTVTGTPSEPGILPRSLDLIFGSVSPHQMSSLELRPKNFSEAVYLSEEESARELAVREGILNKAREVFAGGGSGVEVAGDLTTDTSTNISTLSKASSNYSKVSEPGASLCEIQVQDGSTIDLGDGGDVCYSLWVSFAEIYNEFIYDLLAEEPGGNRRGRPSLRLAEDKNHNHFIKGLLEVRVESMEEALLLLRMGVQHRHVASTCLNYQSSRSHTIFTIKMIKVMAGSDRPHSAFVNRISIVDLAGAERSKETGARGMRVREAGNINNSLLTLGKCIEAMRHNQNKRRGEEHMIPFRESKLTRLFQNYFIGKGKGVRQGKITMLVNVSNNASVFDETVHVLRFSALTSKIIPIVKENLAVPVSQPRPLPPSSRVLRSVTARAAAAAATPLREKAGRAPVVSGRTIEAKRTVSIAVCDHCEAKREEVVKCRGQLAALEVEKMESEYRIRQEVCREFQEQLVEIEDTHREEMEEQAEEMQELYDKRMQLLQKSMKKEFHRKRRRIETEEEEEEEGQGGRGRGEGSRLRDRVSQLEEELQTQRERNLALSAELKDATETHGSRVALLNQQVNGASLRAGEAGAQVRRLEEELSRLRREAEDRESELLATKETLERGLGDLQAELARAKREAGEGESQEKLSELQAELARAKREAGEGEGKLLESQEKLSELQAELARAEGEVGKAGERERELEAARDTLQLQLQETGARVLEKEAENEALQSDRLSLISEYETTEGQLREEMAAMRSELGRTSEAVAARLGREAEDRVQEAEAGREDAVAEVEILQARISELTREAELREAAEDAAVSIVAETDELTLLRETVDHLKSQLGEREAEVESLQTSGRADSEAAQREVSGLQEQVVELEGWLAEREGQVVTLRASRASVARELKAGVDFVLQNIDDLHSRLVESSQAHSDRVDTLAACVAGLKHEVNELQSQLVAREGEVKELQSQLVAREREVKELQSQLVAREGEVNELQSQLVAREGEVNELQSQLVAREGEVNELQSQLVAREREMNELQSQLVAREREMNELQSQLVAREGEMNELQSQLVGKGELQEASRQQLSDRDQELAELKTAHCGAQQELAELKTAHCGAQQELAELKTAHCGAQQELAELKRAHCGAQQELAELKTAHCGAQQELAELKTAHCGAQQELAELRTAHCGAQQELERARDRTAAIEERELQEKEVLSTESTHSPSSEELERPTEEEPCGISKGVPSPSAAGRVARSDSKPFVAVLDRSSQLMEETFSEETTRVVIDATPPIARKGRGRGRKQKLATEADIDTPTKKCKYQLRNRKKHRRFEDEENHLPPLDYLRTCVRSKKVLGSSQPSPPPPPPTTSGTGLRRVERATRSRCIRKSQISGPLGLVGSPVVPFTMSSMKKMGPAAPPLYHDYHYT